MVNLEIIKQNVYKKYKYKLFRSMIFINIFAFISIFISLSSSSISQKELEYIEMNKELSHQNDSLRNFIFNELTEIKKIENELFRKTYKLSTDVELIDSIYNAKMLYGFYDKQLFTYKRISEIVNNKWDSIYHMPLGNPISLSDYNNISNNFGYRMHPILKEVLFHDGIDITADIGSDVFATGNGIVDNIYYSNKGYGNRVVINHKNGYKSVYAHLDEIYVEKGQIVDKNSLLGTVGNTGRSTGPHLHYEILVNNKPVNPINYMYSYNMLVNR